jgi:micrococcal nuclease
MDIKDSYIRNATVLNVVDGDTLDAFVDCGYNIWTKQRFRLLGIDTPERGQLGFKEATAYVEERVLGKDVLIQSSKSDSFGRYLATVFYEGHTINLELLEKGHAVAYVK